MLEEIDIPKYPDQTRSLPAGRGTLTSIGRANGGRLESVRLVRAGQSVTRHGGHVRPRPDKL